MRQRLAIIVTIMLVVGVLIAINAATYIGDEGRQEVELAPNRSTYHSGATGTRALYDLLSETGFKVMRWREIPEKLLGEAGEKVQTFVIIGDTPLAIDANQARSILLWVERGGRLILVDRTPDNQVLPLSGDWTFETTFVNFPSFTVDPANAAEMTENVKPVRPTQPTLLTQSIDTVMPSTFAGTINFHRSDRQKKKVQEEVGFGSQTGKESQGKPPGTVGQEASNNFKALSPAPVVHLADSRGALLLDYPHGYGRIVLLSDPYILSNGGISLKDNLQLAINILTTTEGLIAFDEYHQGRGTTRNAIIGYFSGTPVLPILGQLVFLIIVLLWTRSRRFARPLPLEQVDRRSSLEFVASMAELQQRARAYDLAIENIYARTRRVLARYAGTDYNTARAEIASRVAARSSLESRSLEVLMRQCEEAINGAPVSERQSILLAKRLRDVEGALGLRMRARDAKQAAHKV
ncbi:MAG: DUF4350 domain-containing protein [Pyrinomonadaceae bacterium]